MQWFWEEFKYNHKNESMNTFNLLLYKGVPKLPKTIMVTAGFDPLSDEGENYAFTSSSALVKQLHYPSLFHGFASMTRLKAQKKQ